MPQVPIHNIGSLGIIKDRPGHLLPPEAWSDGQNIRFKDNKVIKATGQKAIFGTPGTRPYWALPVPTPTTYYWLYAGLDDVFVYGGGIHTSIRRISSPYNGNLLVPWTGGLLGGIPVINNGIDLPQVWTPVDTANKLTDLPNWPANATARILRPFKNFLVAYDVTKGGVRDPHMVKWSHSADPGFIPNSWNEADPTKDAGEWSLLDPGGGFIKDALPLGDINVIYKESSIHGQQFIGGDFIFRFFQMFEGTAGLVATNCVNSFKGGRLHFFVTNSDILVNTGQSLESPIESKMRNWLFKVIDQENIDRCYTFAHEKEKENWFCFPESGLNIPNLALVWNWETQSCTIKQLNKATYVASGIISEGALDNWDNASGSFDADTGVWGDRTFGIFQSRPLILNADDQRFAQLDESYKIDGANYNSFVERAGLSIIGQDRQGNPKSDITTIKQVSSIWPKLTGGPISIRVGSQDFIDGPMRWTTPQQFNPQTQTRLDLLDSFVPGRLIAVRFENITDQPWELHGYDLDVNVIGA